jgi:hypothetical protein
VELGVCAVYQGLVEAVLGVGRVSLGGHPMFPLHSWIWVCGQEVVVQHVSVAGIYRAGRSLMSGSKRQPDGPERM